MDFEYDAQKSESNKIKHGIDFEEARVLWGDSESIEVLLPFDTESRYMVIAFVDDRYWTAIITRRDSNVRIISVRRSRQNEKELYDNSKRV